MTKFSQELSSQGVILLFNLCSLWTTFITIDFFTIKYLIHKTRESIEKTFNFKIIVICMEINSILKLILSSNKRHNSLIPYKKKMRDRYIFYFIGIIYNILFYLFKINSNN